MSETEIEAQLTLKDRLNYPYYLGDAILTRNRSILKENYSEQEIIEATENLLGLLPKSWEDEQFKKDLEEATIKNKIDVRPNFCGIRPSIEYCEEYGIPTFKEEIIFDYKKLYRACINLMDRRGLTARREFTEKMTGKPHKKGSKDIADSETYEL
jgi:hypothetical protein